VDAIPDDATGRAISFFVRISASNKLIKNVVTLGFSPNIPLQESLVAYKIPSLASAKTSARATPSRIFDLIRRIFTHVFFSSESTVPRAFADRFVRVKSIYYLVPGIFLFVETLWMVCCIVSVWKV
jgi:hypothetical protein